VRSIKEIRFRLGQEAANIRLLARAPSLPASSRRPSGLAALPDPDTFVPRLRGTRLAHEIERLAESICRHRFPILGYEIETGGEIHWRRDYIHGVESDLSFFRRIPYLDPARAGDHKIIWELNRHQHLVTLAQAAQLTGRPEFLDEIGRQLESWWRQNPYVRGINWTSALEVAFRALSWVWIWRLAGPDLPSGCADRLLNELYRHGVYLEHNLSVYFSPNTHLLGEAVALHALGVLFPDWPRSKTWRSLGGRIVAEEMQIQVREDGSHFEQSTAYHVYSTDFFLFHALLEGVSDAYLGRLRRMADYLAALSSTDGTIPLMGDDDGGRLFHPYGNRRRFGAATLATCCVFFGSDDWPYRPADLEEQAAWWCGEKAFAPRPGHAEPAKARLFPDAGVAILSSVPTHIVVDTRAFGHANAGHSHAHALQIVCRHADRDILIDPGTYTYVGEPEWRSRFRGTAFHNTVRVDGLDQATGVGPFRWSDKPVSEVLRWIRNQDWCLLDAACTFHGIRHRRILLWIPLQEILAVVDEITAAESREAPGKHKIEQFWHCGGAVSSSSIGNYRIGAESSLVFPTGSSVTVSEGGNYGWQSEVPGNKIERPVIVVEQETSLPALMGALLFLRPQSDLSAALEARDDRIRLNAGGSLRIEVSKSGDPIIHREDSLVH
jgi:hypothetical protein